MNVLRFLINTNIYISLAAVALAVESQIQLGMRPQWRPYLFMLFFATLFEYNIHRLTTVILKKEAMNDEKHKWVRQHLKLFYLLVAASVAGFACSIFLVRKEVLVTFAPVALLTLFYSLPVFKTEKHIFRLREIAYLKILLIAFVWAVVTVFLPVVQSGKLYDKGHVLLMFTERFIFLLAITIPFDIRDMKADERSGLMTIPLRIGEKKATALANVFLFLFLVFCFLHYSNSQRFILSPLIISTISTLFFINSKKLKKFHYYHYGVLDGTLLLQGLLVYVCYYLQNH